MLQGIEELFFSIECDNSAILQLLGDNTTVTTNNVPLYLEVIEKRITDMFSKVHWTDKIQKRDLRLDENKKPRMKTPILTEIAPTQPCPL